MDDVRFTVANCSLEIDEVESIEGRVRRGFDRTRKLDLPIRMSLTSGSGESLLRHVIYVKGADTDREMLGEDER